MRLPAHACAINCLNFIKGGKHKMSTNVLPAPICDHVYGIMYRILPNTRASPNRRAPQIFGSRRPT